MYELCRRIPRSESQARRKKFADSSYPSLLNYFLKKKVNEASYVC